MKSKPSGEDWRPGDPAGEERDQVVDIPQRNREAAKFGGGSTARLEAPGGGRSDSSATGKARIMNWVQEENWA